jgi:hypothetical protein
MSRLNPNCDGDQCLIKDGELKIYPLDDGAKLILCITCFAYENQYRRSMGIKGQRPQDWPLVHWDTATPVNQKAH